jgi:hypothetical protein
MGGRSLQRVKKGGDNLWSAGWPVWFLGGACISDAEERPWKLGKLGAKMGTSWILEFFPELAEDTKSLKQIRTFMGLRK